MPEPPLLFAFRFLDPQSGKWTRARYRASIDDIRKRYSQWELIGPPELRKGGATMFSPFERFPRVDAGAGLREEPAPQLLPSIDALECMLVGYFLRRYITYCARRRRFGQMQGALALLRDTSAPRPRTPT